MLKKGTKFKSLINEKILKRNWRSLDAINCNILFDSKKILLIYTFKKSMETKAILIEKSSGHGVNETANGTFKYKVQNKHLEYNQSGDYNF